MAQVQWHDRAGSMKLEQRVALERRRLQRASAILLCASFAATHDHEGDYGDVMHTVASMIDHVVNALDTVEMNRTGEARAVIAGLHDAAEACTTEQAALRTRLEQAAHVIDQLLEVHPSL